MTGRSAWGPDLGAAASGAGAEITAGTEAHRRASYVAHDLCANVTGARSAPLRRHTVERADGGTLPLGVLNCTASDMGPMPFEFRAWILK